MLSHFEVGFLNFCVITSNYSQTHEVPTETGTACSVPLDYSDIVVTFSACGL